METRRSRLVFIPVLLIGGGIVWGWLWVSVIHIVAYFYIIAPVVDIVAYGVVGVRVHRWIQSSVDARPSHRALLGILAMASFYTGNRVILFGWLLGIWPFQGGGVPSWIFLVWETLAIVVGLIAVAGLWEKSQPRRWAS